MRSYRTTRPAEGALSLRGWTGVWITVLIIGEVLAVLVATVLYLLGLSAAVVLTVLTLLATGSMAGSLILSRRYGAHGLARRVALARLPRILVFRRPPRAFLEG